MLPIDMKLDIRALQIVDQSKQHSKCLISDPLVITSDCLVRRIRRSRMVPFHAANSDYLTSMSFDSLTNSALGIERHAFAGAKGAEKLDFTSHGNSLSKIFPL